MLCPVLPLTKILKSLIKKQKWTYNYKLVTTCSYAVPVDHRGILAQETGLNSHHVGKTHSQHCTIDSKFPIY